jgi:FecR protein
MKAQKLVMEKLVTALAVGLGGGVWLSTAWAAGNVDTARGEVSVLSREGSPRGVAKGDRVVEGETILTGPDGEVLLTTDDSGVLAIRPRSRMTIETYKVNGNDKDSVVLNLLRGSLRSVTGWISKTAPKNYRVTTNTATIGIRGTDHEVVVDGESGGTYNKVTDGGTTLSNSAGTLEQTPTSNGTGFVRAGDQMPTPAPAPVTLFAPRPSDQRFFELKQDAQTNQPTRLQTRQQQVSSSGGLSPQGNPRVSTQCTPDAPAQQALDALLRAYERGDIGFLQTHIDPAMIGFGTLINDVINDTNAQRQTRIQITDRQMQCGPDVSVIDFAWEKYYLASANFAPVVTRGRGSVLITGLGGGFGGQWRISGLVGDSPLRGGGVGTDGTLQVVGPTSASYANIPVSCNASGFISTTAPASTTSTPSVFFSGPPASAATCSATVNFASCSVNVNPAVYSIVSAFLGTSSTPTCNVSNPGTGTASASVAAFSATGTTSFSGTPGTTVNVTIPASFSGNAAAPASSWSGTFNAGTTCVATLNILSTAPVTCGVVQNSLPVVLEVRDADVTASSLTVQVSASNGDIETFVLPQISAGVYRLSSIPVSRGQTSVSPGNGRIDFVGATTGAVVLTVRYNDARTSTGSSIIRQTTVTLN